MVDSVGFTDAVAGAPSYSGRALRQLNAVAFAGATSARPLGARSGVRPGTPSTTVTATSTTWTCQPFAGVLDGQTAAEAGPYPFAFDAVAAGAVTAADASNPRIDIIYVDVDDPSEDASSVPAATRKYLAGTAAAIPAAPATPAGGMVIAQINVPKSGSGSPTVTWVAPYLAAAGGVIPFATKSEMVAVTTLPAGTQASANGVVYVYTSTGWVEVGRSAAVSLGKTVSQQLPVASTVYPVTWDVENADVLGMHDAVNPSRVTIVTAGLYLVTYAVKLTSTSGTAEVYLRKNGASVLDGSGEGVKPGVATYGVSFSRSLSIPLVAGDYVELMATASVAGPFVTGGAAHEAAVLTVALIGS